MKRGTLLTTGGAAVAIGALNLNSPQSGSLLWHGQCKTRAQRLINHLADMDCRLSADAPVKILIRQLYCRTRIAPTMRSLKGGISTPAKCSSPTAIYLTASVCR
jgi:hypothetical protein